MLSANFFVCAIFRHTQLSGTPLPDGVVGKIDAAFQTLQNLCHGKTYLVCLDDVSDDVTIFLI
jgi:hypothetical protein